MGRLRPTINDHALYALVEACPQCAARLALPGTMAAVRRVRPEGRYGRNVVELMTNYHDEGHPTLPGLDAARAAVLAERDALDQRRLARGRKPMTRWDPFSLWRGLMRGFERMEAG